ncbi:MAG: glycosyltransferase family 4 protein [Spirochaetes bacterium]|nr:glycosyltransferase family 4 protein [Spirochaetota bacterium]
MKVLLLCYRGNPYCGGQGIYLYHLSKELARLGVEVDVIVGPPYPEPLEDWAAVYKLDNLNIWSIRTSHIPYEKLVRVYSPLNFADYFLTRFHIFPEMETFSIRAFALLKELLKTKRYDIIHDVNSLGWGMALMKGFGIPVVSTIHHPLTQDMQADLGVDKSFWEKMTTILFYPIQMQRFVIRRMDRVITSSIDGISELRRAFGLDEHRISVVYNGMDVEAFRNTGEPREDRSLLFVGNTEDHKKGLTYLLEAMTMLPEDVTLTIVDDGPPKKLNAANLIERFRLATRVTITGKLDMASLVSLYSRKTVLVMSSLHEGFGLPAAEAMACETPVVVTRAGALTEVVDDRSGILVEMRNPAALRDAVMKLLEDPGLRREMGAYGRTRAVENFAWPSAARNTMKVYESVIQSYRSRS